MQQPLGAVRDAVEGIPHHQEIGPAGLGDHQPLPLAVEQLHPEFGFQRFDLMADRALRDEQLFGRPREALVAGRSLEGFEGVQRR